MEKPKSEELFIKIILRSARIRNSSYCSILKVPKGILKRKA